MTIFVNALWLLMTVSVSTPMGGLKLSILLCKCKCKSYAGCTSVRYDSEHLQCELIFGNENKWVSEEKDVRIYKVPHDNSSLLCEESEMLVHCKRGSLVCVEGSREEKSHVMQKLGKMPGEMYKLRNAPDKVKVMTEEKKTQKGEENVQKVPMMPIKEKEDDGLQKTTTTSDKVKDDIMQKPTTAPDKVKMVNGIPKSTTAPDEVKTVNFTQKSTTAPVEVKTVNDTQKSTTASDEVKTINDTQETTTAPDETQKSTTALVEVETVNDIQKSTTAPDEVKATNDAQKSTTAPDEVTAAYDTEKSTTAPDEVKAANDTEESTTAPDEVKTVSDTEKSTTASDEVKTVSDTEKSTTAPDEVKTVSDTEKSTTAPDEEKTVSDTEKSTTVPDEVKTDDVQQRTPTHDKEDSVQNQTTSHDDGKDDRSCIVYKLENQTFEDGSPPGSKLLSFPNKVETGMKLTVYGKYMKGERYSQVTISLDPRRPTNMLKWFHIRPEWMTRTIAFQLRLSITMYDGDFPISDPSNFSIAIELTPSATKV